MSEGGREGWWRVLVEVAQTEAVDEKGPKLLKSVMSVEVHREAW